MVEMMPGALGKVLTAPEEVAVKGVSVPEVAGVPVPMMLPPY